MKTKLLLAITILISVILAEIPLTNIDPIPIFQDYVISQAHQRKQRREAITLITASISGLITGILGAYTGYRIIERRYR